MSTTSPPRVPIFGLLTFSTTLTFATFSSVLPILPTLSPTHATPVRYSLILNSFLLPALLLYLPLLSERPYPPFPSLPFPHRSRSLFTLSSLLSAISSFLLSFSPIIPPSLPLIFIGISATLQQTLLVRLVALHQKPLRLLLRRRAVGFHLAFLEACIALGAIVAPFLAAHALTPAFIFIPIALAQLILAIAIIWLYPTSSFLQSDETIPLMSGRKTPTVVTSSSSEPSEGDVDLEQGEEEISQFSSSEEPIDPGIAYVLRHPWVWFLLFCMLLSASSSAFLRPLLAYWIVVEKHGTAANAALLFSMIAFAGAIAQPVASAGLAPRIGIRSTVLLGLGVSLVGFHALTAEWKYAGVILVAVGASTSLVMSVCDLAITTKVQVSGEVNSLSLIAAATFSYGEITGTSLGGILWGLGNDRSFKSAVSMWSSFLSVVCVAIVSAYLLGLLVQWLMPILRIIFARGNTSPRSMEQQESRTLLDVGT